MKKLITLVALMMAIPASAMDRSQNTEISLAKIYSCYWYYSDVGDTEKASLLQSAHGKASLIYTEALGGMYRVEAASRNMIKLYTQINLSYDLSKLCPTVHDIVVKSEL